MKLHNKHIILTGASGGIGSETAKLLAKNGAHIALVDRNAETLENIRDEVAPYGTRLIIIAADLTTATGRRSVIEQTLKTFGNIDMLINKLESIQ